LVRQEFVFNNRSDYQYPVPEFGSKNLYLLGLRGTGKSTVGPLLAQNLQRPFWDLDLLVQQTSGRTILEIFSTEGEEEFRRLESLALRRVAAGSQQVIALGGGAILASENRQLIRETGWGVWLQARSEILHERICSDADSTAERPPLTDRSGIDELRLLADQRKALYAECADYAVNVENWTATDIAHEIAIWFQSVDNNEGDLPYTDYTDS
jgi:shikimate kinase